MVIKDIYVCVFLTCTTLKLKYMKSEQNFCCLIEKIKKNGECCILWTSQQQDDFSAGCGCSVSSTTRTAVRLFDPEAALAFELFAFDCSNFCTISLIY